MAADQLDTTQPHRTVAKHEHRPSIRSHKQVMTTRG
jgi:hypothetical protein